MKYKDTSEIKVPEKLIDQIIGQDRAVKIIRNAAKQRRNILLIGTPGTGKSMLAQGMAELMPAEELEDVLMYPNRIDENNPLVRVLKTKAPAPGGSKKDDTPVSMAPQEQKGKELGQGRLIIEQERMRNRTDSRSGISPVLLIVGIAIVVLIYFSLSGGGQSSPEDNRFVLPALIIAGGIIISFLIFSSQFSKRMGGAPDVSEPKLVVDNSGKKAAPFVDATGSKAGALFGDVKHDPLQSFMPDSKFYMVEGKKLIPTSFASLWKKMNSKYPERIERKEDYEYITFPSEEEVYVLTVNDDSVLPTRVMSMNRRLYEGMIVKISNDEGELVTTPEHKYVLEKGEREAEGLAEGDKLISI